MLIPPPSAKLALVFLVLRQLHLCGILVGQHTQLDEIPNSTHDQESHADCLAYLDEFSPVS